MRFRDADKPWANFLIHLRPQHQYIVDAEENCLLDEVLKYETLDRDMATLFDRYGLQSNPITRPPIREINQYYSRAQRDLINEIYAKDFEHFSYELE